MTSNNAVDTLVANYLSQRLKDAGFQKRKMTWNRRSDQIVHVLDLQLDKSSFTLNFGIFIDEVWQLCWSKPIPKFIGEQNCFPRFRAGQLLDGFSSKAQDKWWPICNEAHGVSKEVISVVFDIGLRVLHEISSAQNALAFAKENLRPQLPLDLIYLGILEYVCGEAAKGAARLEELAGDQYWGNRAQVALKELSRLSAP